VTWSLTLPVAPPDQADQSRPGRAAPRALLTATKPSPPPSRPEAPSTDESPQPRSALMPGTKASWPPLIPWFCHLGSASDTLSRVGNALDPFCLPAFAGARGPPAARRLLQLFGPTSTTSTSPDPVAILRCCHRAAGSDASEESSPAGLSQFRGNADTVASSPPPRRPPASTWIYPKPIDPDTLSRLPMLPARWKKRACSDWPETSPSDDSFRNPWRISSPDSPHLP